MLCQLPTQTGGDPYLIILPLVKSSILIQRVPRFILLLDEPDVMADFPHDPASGIVTGDTTHTLRRGGFSIDDERGE
jgi:hypothetical protein